MTDHTPLTSQDLDEIETRAAHLAEYASQNGGEGDTLADTDVPALIAYVRHLQALVAELEPDSALLSALYAAGVDNWDGYDNAREQAAARRPAVPAAGESGSTR